jgi:hypothetical protein
VSISLCTTSVESSTLDPWIENPQILLLQVSILNTNFSPQDFPAFELTLTDQKARPVASRILLPEDYGKAKGQDFEGRSTLEIKVQMKAVEAVGYKLYLFYPAVEPERLKAQEHAKVLEVLSARSRTRS